MRKCHCFKTAIALLSLFCFSSESRLLLAQSSYPAEVREWLWDAAWELENGNVDIANQILNEIPVSALDSADVSALVARLREIISDIESEQNQQVRNLSADLQTGQGIQVGMSEENLRLYLEELEIAVRLLFAPEKKQ